MKKQKTEKLKTNKGITLIALVITIIVMLILVAVTISMAVNGGLFEQAGRAASQTQKTRDEERKLANIAAGMTVDELIDKYRGTKITAQHIAQAENKELYYGKRINNYQSPTTGVTWRIFHSDGENIYLIASDYVQNKPNVPGTSYGFSIMNGDILDNYAVNTEGKKWINTNTNPAIKWIDKVVDGENVVYDYIGSTNKNMEAVAYMLDIELWNTLYKDTQGMADYVIGGPTLKMFAESYNLTHTNAITYQKKGGTQDSGYQVRLGNDAFSDACPGLLSENKTIDNLYVVDKTKALGMYLASPSSWSNQHVFMVFCDGWINIDPYSLRTANCGVRPVVCLSSNVVLEQVGEGANITFNLK